MSDDPPASTSGSGQAEAPAGWYADPEQPGSRWLRYWDGQAWTDQRTKPKKPIPIGVIAWIAGLLAAGLCLRITQEQLDRDAGTEFASSFVATLILVFGVPALVRLVYVKFFVTGARFFTPWLLISSALIALALTV